MKLTLFLCVVLCCAVLATAGKPEWKKMKQKLKNSIKKYTDFVHIFSGHDKVESEDFERTKEAAELLTKFVDDKAKIAPFGSRISVIQFAMGATIHVGLGVCDTLAMNRQEIEGIDQAYDGGAAQVGEGLLAAEPMFNQPAIGSVSKAKIAWLVTNRVAESGENAADVADRLKNLGVKIFVIAIGDINRWKFLKKLATNSGYFFEFSSYEDYLQAVRDMD